jgi:acetyl esterase
MSASGASPDGTSRGERVEAAVARIAGALPRPLVRALGGRPIEIDGQRLDPEAQLALRLRRLAGSPSWEELPLAEARAEVEREARVVRGRQVAVARVEDLEVDGAAGPIGARLYVPAEERRALPLLVYYHGGGWTLGSIETHDNTCRFLAQHAGVLVLSVDYRLAPEHRFPAAVDDALAAFRWAAAHGGELGADTAAIAVGGDSAGGTLAAVTSRLATEDDGPAPGFQLLFFPVMDLSRRHPSHVLFGEGFFLTTKLREFYNRNYLPDPEAALDPRASPLLAAELSGLPPTYVATAGFDPLRDEGATYAARLREAGVRVAYRCHRGLPHSFVNVVTIGHAGREATLEAAGALRLGLGA